MTTKSQILRKRMMKTRKTLILRTKKYKQLLQVIIKINRKRKKDNKKMTMSKIVVTMNLKNFMEEI